MSLRSRILLSWGILIALLIAAGLVIVITQRSFAISQVDDRLRSLEPTALKVVHRVPDSGSKVPIVDDTRLAAGLYGLWVGYEGPNGEPLTLANPADRPDLAPVVTPGLAYTVPTTVPAASPSTGRMRVVSFPMRAGSSILLAASLDDVDLAIARLVRTLVAALIIVAGVSAVVIWWTLRLGVAPIRRVTEVAHEIRQGDTTVRVESFPAGTEAQELGQAFNTLVDANAASEERLRRFVADASHELRTPLATLSGYASLYAAGGLSDRESVDDAMGRIRQEAGRMQVLVDDLMLLAELDQRPRLNLSSVDLVPLVNGLVADLRVVDPDRVITLTSPTSLGVSGDSVRLTQVVAILTSNAARHTPPGTPIDVRIIAEPALAKIEVTDHGPGIAEQDVSHIFERFYRGGQGRARTSGGSGLGLAIASAIVSAHGGRIGVDSTPGNGSSFWIELPLAPLGPPLALTS